MFLGSLGLRFVEFQAPLASVSQECEGRTADLRVTRRAWKRASRSAPSIAIWVVALILLGSVWQAHTFTPSASSRATGALPLLPQPTASRSPSAWLSPGPAVAVGHNATSPAYDEQIGATFSQNFATLAYNVTALAQTDADGYGPAYILNGLTAQDYFYQVSVSYHWPLQPGIFPGFGFGYDVFGPDDTPVYPTSGGSGLVNFSSTVNSGDKVLLSLTFTSSTVQMTARDWNTGATAQTSYSSEGSSSFVGSQSRSNFQGYFTGLMTEWYHFAPYSGNQRGVTYTNDAVGLTSVSMWIDEFDTAQSGPPLFSNDTRVTFANDRQLYPFYADGAMMFVSAHQFITGLPTTASTSELTLATATKETSTPSFSASFVLLGQLQTISIPAGASILGADPGTTITISTNSGTSLFDRWVFDGTSGMQVTVAAGANTTFVVYHLVQQIVAYQVAAGGKALPTSPAVEFSYEVPPSVASSTPGSAAATQVVGTTPVAIYALLGSDASVNGTVLGAPGERWVANERNWSITAYGLVPYPIEFYQQYEVSVGYSIIGGGTSSQAPEFMVAVFGSLTSISLTSVPTTGWFDAGSAYSFTRVINGSGGTERWVSSGGAGSAPPPVVSSPLEALSEVYTAQFYARLAVNDASGGTVSNASGWFDRGSTLAASASANQGWHFEGWNGSGTGAYTGASPSIDVVVAGPLNENATFYVQLAITADAGTNIAFSYASHAGTVQAGMTETLDIPPSNVTLRAAPSFFVYSFTSWQGAGDANAKKPSLVLAVDSPTTVAGKSSYDYAGVLVLASGVAALVLNVVVGSQWIRGRRGRENPRGFLRLATASPEILPCAVTRIGTSWEPLDVTSRRRTLESRLRGRGNRSRAPFLISTGVILIRIGLFCCSYSRQLALNNLFRPFGS